MEYREIDGTYLVRLSRGEEIVASITKFLQERDIQAGGISGIGAASHVTLRYFDIDEKKYFGKDFEGKFEIASLTGNVSTMDGVIWPHIHIVLGDTDYSTFGGHLEKGTVGVTCEVIITPLPTEISREFDEETGLKLWKLTSVPQRE